MLICRQFLSGLPSFRTLRYDLSARACKSLAVLLLALFLSPGSARADFTAMANLDGVSEVPPNVSPAFGSADVIYQSGPNNLAYMADFNALLGNGTSAGIQVGAPGMNGPVIFNFNPGPAGATTGTLNGVFTAADLIPQAGAGINTFADAVNAINNGNAYVNIRSNVFPGGEIRGQLLVAPSTPEPGALAVLFGIGVSGSSLLRRRRR